MDFNKEMFLEEEWKSDFFEIVKTNQFANKLKETAINAFESRIQNVACVILPYEQAGNIQGKWWYSDCIPNIVFVNRWNTIIEVFYYYTSYEEVEAILYDTAKEIMHRVDNLSTEINL